MVHDGARRLHDAEGNRAAAALSEPHAQIQARLQPQLPLGKPEADLKRAVRTEKIALGKRRESACAQGGDDGNEPVDHDRQALARRAQKHARHCAQIEAADFGQNVNRVVGVRLMKRERVRDDLFFLQKRRVGQAAAATGDILDACARERGKNCRRGRRVADAHLADT